MKKFQRRKSQTTSKRGFTMIEITIVMAFVAMLLIAIATIVSNMLALFQKGMTLGAVNSVGRNLISEFNSTINSAPSIDSTSLCRKFLSGDAELQNKCISNGAFNFIYQSRTKRVEDRVTGQETDVQMNGIFCTGSYSYMWNTWYGLDDDETLRLVYTTDGTDHEELKDFKLIRFEDKTYRACEQRVDHSNYAIMSPDNADYDVIDMTESSNGQRNLLSSGPQNGFIEASEANLDLYELVIFPVSQDVVTQRAFFSGTFILGTGNGDATITRAEETCSLDRVVSDPMDPDNPEDDTNTYLLDLGSKFNYCGINKFNFAVRSAGSGI